MRLGPHETVLCSGTLPPGISFASRLEAATAGGFTGISLWLRDIHQARADGLSDADMVAMLADAGLRVAELDPVWRWLPGSDLDIAMADDASGVLYPTLDDFLRAADTFGAQSLNACEILSSPDWTLDDAAACFAKLCDRAADHGMVVHLEFLPWSRIADVKTAHDIVHMADRPNGGLMLDSWHFFRGTPDLEALRQVPGERLTALQLSDGPAAPAENLMVEALEARLFPGSGSFDLAALCSVLDEIGAVAPMGVEVMSAAHENVDVVELGRRAGSSIQPYRRA